MKITNKSQTRLDRNVRLIVFSCWANWNRREASIQTRKVCCRWMSARTNVSPSFQVRACHSAWVQVYVPLDTNT